MLQQNGKTLEPELQRVAALRGFWDFEKTTLSKIRMSGIVGGPLLTQKNPTYAYIGQTAEVGECISDLCINGGPL